MTTKLWCIHIPGPDEIYAAPDHETAVKMAEKHNAAMNDYLDATPDRRSQFGIPLGSVFAEVIEWPGGDAESHAASLLEFDAKEWGFEEPPATEEST
jgi:hypothetical protein